MELHVWISDNQRISLEAEQGEDFNEEKILREVAVAVEKFTLEKYGVMLTVEVAE